MWCPVVGAFEAVVAALAVVVMVAVVPKVAAVHGALERFMRDV